MASAHLSIAVVDDEQSVRTMLKRVLRLADYEVAVFGSGEEFLASLATQVPACVVLDVHMPGLSGLDVQSRLRGARTDIPVVFITASDDPSLDQVVRLASGGTLLRKPFSSKDLLNAVQAAVQLRREAP